MICHMHVHVAHRVLGTILSFSPDAAFPLLGVPFAAHLLKLGGTHFSVAMLHSLCTNHHQAAAAIASHGEQLWHTLRQWQQLYRLHHTYQYMNLLPWRPSRGSHRHSHMVLVSPVSTIDSTVQTCDGWHPQADPCMHTCMPSRMHIQ